MRFAFFKVLSFKLKSLISQGRSSGAIPCRFETGGWKMGEWLSAVWLSLFEYCINIWFYSGSHTGTWAPVSGVKPIYHPISTIFKGPDKHEIELTIFLKICPRNFCFGSKSRRSGAATVIAATKPSMDKSRPLSLPWIGSRKRKSRPWICSHILSPSMTTGDDRSKSAQKHRPGFS